MQSLISDIQNRLIEQHFSNSFFKLSQRQLSIFETQQQRKDYIEYLVFTTLNNLHLSFVQSIGFQNKSVVEYQLNQGKVVIPKQFVQGEQAIYLLPLIGALVEYKNIHNFEGATDHSLLLSLINKNTQLIFKSDGIFEPTTKYNTDIAYKDYFEEKALDFMIRNDKAKPTLINNIPNIERCYKTKKFLMIKNNRSYVVFNH